MWCYQFWNFELCLRKKSQNLKRNFTRVFKWFLNNDFFYFWSSCMTITSRFRDGFCPWSFMIAHDCPRWPWMVGWIFFFICIGMKKTPFMDVHWRSLTIIDDLVDVMVTHEFQKWKNPFKLNCSFCNLLFLFNFSIISSGSDLLIDQNSPDKVSLDLKSLRAARVIRPLKLVNGVPSNFIVVFFV